MSDKFILSAIPMTTLFYKALILQGEIWCWSLLGLKGLKVTWFEKRSLEGLITNSMGEGSERVDLKSFLLQMLRFNTSLSVVDPDPGECPPPHLFLDQTCSEVLLLLVKSWKLERHIVLLMKKPSGLPWSFKPQYQYAYSSHCFDTSAGENLFKDKDISLWWSFPSFSWPVCLIRQCYYWEKLDAGHFWPGALGLNKK